MESIRITPACAGNRKSQAFARLLLQDHPRVCGEQSSGPHIMELRIGSPPRVRGTDDGFVDKTELVGITPACAGNSRGA